MIQAVIFDMDGTLIDTEKYYRICWPQALAHFGYTMSDETADGRISGTGWNPDQTGSCRTS